MEISSTHDLAKLHGVTYCFSEADFQGLAPETCWTREVGKELWACVRLLRKDGVLQPLNVSVAELEKCMEERGWKEGNGVWVGGSQEES